VEMSEQQTVQPEAVTEQHKRAGSGYRRLQNRHKRLIEEKEELQRDYFVLLDQQAALQKDVERLLQEHRRLMENVRSPSAVPWFEGANMTLAQLAMNPDPRAVQVFVAALAQLQSRVSPIVARTPL
jgi:chromosome segregation ATPase